MLKSKAVERLPIWVSTYSLEWTGILYDISTINEEKKIDWIPK